MGDDEKIRFFGGGEGNIELFFSISDKILVFFFVTGEIDIEKKGIYLKKKINYKLNIFE